MIDEMFSNIMNYAREMFVELKQYDETRQLQNKSSINHVFFNKFFIK